MGDEQDQAEIIDEQARGVEDEPETHAELMDPDGGGNDDVAELVATEEEAEGPVSPEEAALHLE